MSRSTGSKASKRTPGGFGTPGSFGSDDGKPTGGFGSDDGTTTGGFGSNDGPTTGAKRDIKDCMP